MSEISKYAFTGAGGVGKTTLVEYLLDHSQPLGSVVVEAPEAARKFFEEHPGMPDEARFSLRIQGEVQEMQWRNEQAAEEKARRMGRAAAVICDRSVYDAPVYVGAQGDRGGEGELFRRARSWNATYAGLFLLDPSDVPFENDDVRTESEAAREQIHNAYIRSFEERGIPYMLLGGSVEERGEIVYQHIARDALRIAQREQ